MNISIVSLSTNEYIYTGDSNCAVLWFITYKHGTLAMTAACPSRTTAPSNATPIMLKSCVPWANDDHGRSIHTIDYWEYLTVMTSIVEQYLFCALMKELVS